MNNVVMTTVPEAQEEKYFLSELKTSTAIEVGFSDGSKNKYAGDKSVNVGDIFVVAPGCKSSYAIGQVKSVAGTQGKTHHLIGALMSFKKNPSKADIKKCFDGIKKFRTKEEIEESFEFYPFGCFVDYDAGLPILDIIISNILKALTVITYPEFASSRMIEESTRYLSEKKEIPASLFSADMNECFSNEEVVLLFSGFYPEWKDQLNALSVWKDEVIQEKGDFCDDESQMTFTIQGNSSVAKAFSKNEEFQSFINKSVHLSVFSVLLRAGLVNLLKTALSVSLPIADFYQEIVALADVWNVEKGGQILKNTDYASKTFEKPKSAVTGKEKGTKSITSNSDFVFDDQTLVSYKGKDEIVTVPDGTKIIGAEAFAQNSTAKKIILPDTVTQLKKNAMFHCKELEEIVFSKNLSSMGKECFYFCSKLIRIDLSKTKIKILNDSVFSKCSSLSSVILPQTLKKIEGYCFNAGPKLNSLTIPASVESISYWSIYTLDTKEIILEGTEPLIKGESSLLYYSKQHDCVLRCKKESGLWESLVDIIEHDKDLTNQCHLEEL